MELTFEKEVSGWYIVLPEWEGKKAELQMVAGADVLLDLLSESKNTVKMEVRRDDFLEKTATLNKIRHDNFGADYTYNSESLQANFWLCPVVLFLFNEYPKTLFIKTL